MARKALVNKSKQKPKFSTRKISRCAICGRGHGYMRDFDICRICFRDLARQGKLPGIKKASW